MLVDSTLREGEQRFGVYFSNEVKRRLVSLLIRFGVEEIELGVVGRDGFLPELLAFARAESTRLGRRPALSVWSPCRVADLRLAAELGPDRVAVGAPVSDAHLGTRLGWSRDRLLEHVAASLELARDLGLASVSLGLEDATRADPDFALAVARLAQAGGACRVRLSDTVGVAAPAEIAALVGRFKAELRLAVGLHCHDDFGMATANAVSGLAAGADSADVTVLGMGERAGVPALEELAAYLALRRGRAGYDLALLPELIRVGAEAAGMAVSPFKAVVGETLFHVESGLHADGVAKEPSLYEPFPPEAVGARRRIALGKKSGRAAVRRVMVELGLETAGTDLEALTERVRREAAARGRPLTDEEAGGVLGGG